MSPIDDWTPELADTLRDVLAAVTKAKLACGSFEWDLITERSFPIFEESASFDFGKYIDNELGVFTVPASKSITVEYDEGDDEWVKLDASGQRVRGLSLWVNQSGTVDVTESVL